MKRNSDRSPARSGFVLILALGALAILTLLLFSLLGASTHQARAAENEVTLARQKMIADSAVALVIGQIEKASGQVGQTWISQPGLVRTYGASSIRKPTASYKLYSSPQMVDLSGSLAFLATDAPPDWNSSANQSVYVDLNAPASPSLFSTVYPIFDPSAVGTIEGMTFDADRGPQMPVAWLYELQDGTLGPASNGTRTNPIVARVAFWTDDETCKININTAGCGSPWETPRVNSTDDVTWSKTAPAAGEFARYPGHPASTSLAVVWDANGGNSWTPDALLDLTSRYANGGSDFGTENTTPGQVVPPKMDRLYASVDELCFGPTFTGAGQRQTSPLTAAQVAAAHFVLTAHSEAPETTLLGEPRVAIWPVSDLPNDPTRTTAADRAITTAATVGDRAYLFQRHNALSGTDDLDATTAPSNAKLFTDLVARGDDVLPGYGASLTSRYTGATWTQLMLEITDFIRGINAVDPAPAPFVPFAANDPNTGRGLGFVVPLTTMYQPGGVALRGLGRCPTLSSLTLVFYVCGFTFDDTAPVDFTATADQNGAGWTSFFAAGSTNWSHVTGELLRAFVVPSTFQPGCAFPEVSDDCDIEIDGLNGIAMSTAGNDFGFASSPHSRILGDALTLAMPDRAWGGNEGPLAWRAASLDATKNGNGSPYPFAGESSFPVLFLANPYTHAPTKPTVDPVTGHVTWPAMPSLTFPDTTVTVKIRDATGHPLQTILVDLPKFSVAAPTPLSELDHGEDGVPVQPSFYMNLNNRLLATQNNRAFLIQPGDVARSVEAATDLRVIAGLSSVSTTFFEPHPPPYSTSASMSHNLRFADGTSAYGADGTTPLVKTVPYPTATSSLPVVNWADGTTSNFAWSTSPARSAPVGNSNVTMSPLLNGSAVENINGDWDTGLGFAPDGALINLPDAGTALDPATAYFSLGSGSLGSPTQRTPNALVSSPVIFGSLPSGIDPLHPEQSQPWRTLLFCPYPAADAAHPGFANPPDHLVLDQFWMPVVEPYAISGCMATAGKINLNDQIAPFTYLHRSTALRALLHDLRIPAIPTSAGLQYKTSGAAMAAASVWKPLDVDATITELESRYGSPDAYLSESEICTVPLVPLGMQVSALDSFWNGPAGGGRLTGDNLRELPYAQLYSRLTTRSNSYTVYIRAQILQKMTSDPQQNVWNEKTDHVTGEWRGSYEIERYLAPNASAPAANQPLGPYYFRTVSSHRFAP